MRVIIQDNYDKMCKWAANYIAAKIKAHKEDRPFVVAELAKMHENGQYPERLF